MIAFVSLGDIGEQPARGVLHVLGDAVGAGARLHAVGRGAGVRVEGPDAAGAGRPPAGGGARGASGFGMVSSSCSYAATAMAKSLFQKGADFMTAMVFMFASTNLVRRARHRAARADGLAVRGRRVRRRPDHDRRCSRCSAGSCSRRAWCARRAGPRSTRRRGCARRPTSTDHDHGHGELDARAGRLERRGRLHDRPTSGCCGGSW